MLSIISKLIKFNTVQVLGIFRTDASEGYYLINLKKKKNSLNIISSASYPSIEKAIENISLTTPMIILVDGKGVLNKKIDLGNEADLSWKKNMDFESIYFTEIKEGNSIFMSFCRKSTIDEYLKYIKNKGIQIIDFYLGPLAATYVNILIKDNKLYANDTVLEYNNSTLTSIGKANNEKEYYSIGDDKVITKYHLPLYGAGIHYFTNHHSLSKNSPSDIDKSEVLYKKAFELFGKTIIIFFFIALLTSYISIQYLSSENSKLNQKSVYFKQTHQTIKDLQYKKEQKLKILKDAGHMSSHFLNYYSFELAGSVPSAINISSLNIFPILNDAKENKKIMFDPSTILCEGVTASEVAFNQWLGLLKKMPWIERFEIISLKKDKKNVQQFEIKIFVKDV